jgi:preprotein translocase subunit SecD
MKIPWKGLGILAVLALAIWLNMPTIQTFIPEDEAVTKQRLEAELHRMQELIDPLRKIQLALTEVQRNRIRLLTETDFQYPLEHPILRSILADHYLVEHIEGSVFLKLKPKVDRDVFVSKTADQLNGLLTNVRKIEQIALSTDGRTIVFQMAPDQRMSPLAEPLKSLLEGRFELSYREEDDQYLTRWKERENVINLGLDLQGGMYLDIGVKTEEVIIAIMDRLAEELEDQLIADNINYEAVERIADHQVLLLLEPEERFNPTGEEYQRLLDRGFDVAQQDNGFLISLVAEEIDRVKKRAVEQALETIRNRIDQLGVKEPSIQLRGEESIIIQLPGLQDPDQARRIIGTVAVLNFQFVTDEGSIENPDYDQEVLYEEIRDPATKEVISTRPYLVEKRIQMTGERVRDSRVGFLQTTGGAYVSLSLDDIGKREFADITRNNVGRLLAIVLDGKIQSAPRINEEIAGGEAQITGSFTPEEASELALVLRSGALPAPIIINEERTVGPSLGADSIRKSLIALCIGFAAVIFFMMIYYEVAGIFSVLALLFNLFLIGAALAYFQATLTLPGMAGIVLTIGMAVDANVLIFERIREEIGRGSPLRTAVNTGFKRATVTILDSNITTMLAAIVLFQFGTGPIKGFAVTLSIGIAASMFTALIVGRALFELVYLRRPKLEKISI